MLVGREKFSLNAALHGEVLPVMLLTMAAFLLRYLAVPPYQVIAADGPSYVAIARQIFERFDFTGSIHYPPLYPILTGLANLLLNDYEIAGRSVSLLMGSLLPLPVYLLGREMYGRGTGYAAAAIVLVWPEFVFQSSTVLAFSTYFTLLTFGLYLLLLTHMRRGYGLAISSGIVLAAAYLTRQEAFISLVAVLTCLAVATLRRECSFRSLKPLMLAIGVFSLLVSPYVIMVHDVMGIWTMAGKSVVTLTDCLGYYLGRFDLNRDPSFAKIGIMDLIRNYPGYFPHTLKSNLIKLAGVVPVPFLLLAAEGFLARSPKDHDEDLRWFGIGTQFPVLVLLTVFLVSGAYVAPYLPILFIFAGHGMVSLERRVIEWIGRRSPFGGRCCIITALVIAGYVMHGAWQTIPRTPPPPYKLEMDSGRYDQKVVGKLLKKYLPPGSRIMTRSGRIAFYSELPRVDMPQADFRTIISTARKEKVRYLIVTAELAVLRPQLGKLLTPVTGTVMKDLVIYPQGVAVVPGLVLKMVFNDFESQGVAVYEFVE